MSNARKSAKRAFKGQVVKLHDDYQIGQHDSRTLGDVLTRASIILFSCKNDATALAAIGWLAGDTQALAGALAAVTTADTTQAQAANAAVGATGDVHDQGNALYENLLVIQNAANNESLADAPTAPCASTSSRPRSRAITMVAIYHQRPRYLPPYRLRREVGGHVRRFMPQG